MLYSIDNLNVFFPQIKATLLNIFVPNMFSELQCQTQDRCADNLNNWSVCLQFDWI